MSGTSLVRKLAPAFTADAVLKGAFTKVSRDSLNAGGKCKSKALIIYYTRPNLLISPYYDVILQQLSIPRRYNFLRVCDYICRRRSRLLPFG